MQEYKINNKINSLSIIIPAYNEELRLSKTLETITKYFENYRFPIEIIVVDDGSKDNTYEVAGSFKNIRVIKQQPNAGKGAAVRRGMLEATGSHRLFSDADLSTPIYEIEKLIKYFEEGYDICIGSRALVSSLIKVHQPFYREMMGKMFNKIVQLFVFKGIKDTQCGFKAFTSEAANEIFKKAKINGFSFDVEILYLAKRSGFKVKEISVEWYNDERSKVDPVKDSIKMLIEIFKIRSLHK